MTKKCKKCGVPLEGFFYSWVTSKLFGIKESTKEAGVCNKCEEGVKKSCCCCE